MFNEVGFKWGDQNQGKMLKIKVNATSFWCLQGFRGDCVEGV